MILQLLSEWTSVLIPLIIGAFLGLSFADIDLAPPLPISHRSAWSHGLIVPLGIWWAMLNTAEAWVYWAGVGFLPAFALHCAYDMFPRQWVSIANISLAPLPGRLPGLLSFGYLGASVLVSLGVFALLAPGGIALVAVLAVVAWAGRKYVKKESATWPIIGRWIEETRPMGLWWLMKKCNDAPPLAVYAVSAWVVFFIV